MVWILSLGIPGMLFPLYGSPKTTWLLSDQVFFWLTFSVVFDMGISLTTAATLLFSSAVSFAAAR
jgi:hypothetical protein